MIGFINRTRRAHVVTIEDPIEVLHTDNMSLIWQREIGPDTASYAAGLRQVLRQDPDVIFVGEIRDADTALSAIQPAPPASTAEPGQAPSISEEDAWSAIRAPEGPSDAAVDANEEAAEAERPPASPFADIAFREETVTANGDDSEPQPSPQAEKGSGPRWSFGRH